MVLLLPIQRHLTAFLCVSSFSAFELNFRCRNQDFVITSVMLDYRALFFDTKTSGYKNNKISLC